MSQYSIILVPENCRESKRYKLSKFTVHFTFFAVVLFVAFSTVMTWGFLHYRRLAEQNNQTSTSVAEEIYRSQLINKITTLEDSLKRTQQFSTRLESLIGVDSGKIKIGVGGARSEQEDFSKYLGRASLLTKTKNVFTDDQESSQPQSFYNRLSLKVEALSDYAFKLEAQVNEVYELGQDKLSFWASTPSIFPVRGWVTSDFGVRFSPFTGSPKFHEGLDIAAPYGSPIYAPADGIATFAGPKGGYGNALILDHGYGVATLYGHTSSILVKPGEKIKRGQLIAAVGSTGASTGPHLHYEVHVDGVPTDPMKFTLNKKGKI